MNQPQKDKGQLSYHSKTIIAVGLIVVLLVMGIFSKAASALMEYSTPLAFVSGSVGVIAVIAIGVWFEKKCRRP